MAAPRRSGLPRGSVAWARIAVIAPRQEERGAAMAPNSSQRGRSGDATAHRVDGFKGVSTWVRSAAVATWVIAFAAHSSRRRGRAALAFVQAGITYAPVDLHRSAP